jgi:hypothetical protein
MAWHIRSTGHRGESASLEAVRLIRQSERGGESDGLPLMGQAATPSPLARLAQWPANDILGEASV